MTFTELTETKIWDMPKNMDKYYFIAPSTGDAVSNVKLGDGIYTWSTLISDRNWRFADQFGNIVIVKGTCNNCGGCAKENERGRIPCYVEKSIYGPKGKSVMKNHVKNTLGLRNNIKKVLSDLDKFMAREEKKLNHGIKVRLDQAGEIENEDQLFMWCMLAERHPESIIYVYTKNFDTFLPVLKAGQVPENLIVLFSIWHEQGIKEYNQVKHIKNVRAFIYVDGFDYKKHGVKFSSWCKAYSKDGSMDHGNSCTDCELCYSMNQDNKEIGCFDHT